MKKALAVARWEFVEKVKSKAFLISLFLMPVIMIAFGVLPTLLASKADTETRIIGVIDQTGQLFLPLSNRIEEKYKLANGRSNYILRLIDRSPYDDESYTKEKADKLVLNGEIEGYIIIKSTIFTDTTTEYRSQNVGNIRLIERLTRTLRDILFEKKLVSEGFDPEIIRKLSARIELKSVKLSKTGEEEEAGFTQVFFSAYIFLMMMFFLIMTSGQLLVRSVVEEKMNRIVEVLMSSCSAKDLMMGKILGLSALGFTQVGFWALIGLILSLKLGFTLISLSSALLLLIFFILGYLLYAAIFVGAGAPLSTEQEAQQVTSYLVMFMIIPLVVAFPVIQNPDSLFVYILTYIPLLTPTMMALRIPVQMPPMYEIIISIILLLVTTYAAMWVAGKIFRTAILAYGKRPGLKELLILLRAK